MARKLSQKEVGAIIMAQRAGLSKRELLESDVRVRRIQSLTHEQQMQMMEREMGVLIPKFRAKTIEKQKEEARVAKLKAEALIALKKNPKAKEFFILESPKTVREGQLEEFR